MSKDGKRERILNAAMDIFLKEGYDRATMKEIAKTAGVGKGTTYEYFPSKEALFYDVMQKGFRYFFTELSNAISGEGTVYEKMVRMYERHHQIFRTETRFRDLMMNDFGKISEELQVWLIEQEQAMINQLEEIVNDGIESGELRNVHPRIAASTMLHSLRVVYFYPLKDGETLEKLAEAQIDIFFGGVRK